MEKRKGKYGQRILFGSLVGAANSLFGGGGGMIAVPLLQKTGLTEKGAHATAILLILPICLLSFLIYAYNGYASAQVLIPTAIGVSAGGFLGARLLGKLPVKAVNLTFALLQLFAGVFLVFSH
ncbi:MAG: sulfite exporter TauE/SafE family protein [Clostridia bacterium]|nr:sulfite exporter TauE/SafE family protein [Clostridia bacterium]